MNTLPEIARRLGWPDTDQRCEMLRNWLSQSLEREARMRARWGGCSASEQREQLRQLSAISELELEDLFGGPQTREILAALGHPPQGQRSSA